MSRDIPTHYGVRLTRGTGFSHPDRISWKKGDGVTFRADSRKVAMEAGDTTSLSSHRQQTPRPYDALQQSSRCLESPPSPFDPVRITVFV